ncbi:TonB-dependent receptor [Maribellus maritimus]|uniref:TonB-dependent receptor n=1 Tax=Maribellus maritimus TaxID=2870838 RepID=UPI001EEB032F|nr:TonB-dependent receptor [Maribellus maritimus]MCG6189373.1 TonB-dependent receptor [Maribellus maritimus]
MKLTQKSWLWDHDCLRSIFLISPMTILILLASGIRLWANDVDYQGSAKLSVSYEKATVGEVIKHIEKISEFYFLYRKEIVNEDRKVSFDLKDASIEKILFELFKGEKLDYEIRDKQIIVTRKKDSNLPTSIQAKDQEREIYGTVTNRLGELIPGASVSIKGTQQGTVTSTDGKFALKVPDGAEFIVVSFIGLQTKEVEITGQQIYSIVLEDEIIGVDEVVVVAYGTSKKSSFVGSASLVSEEKMKKIKTSNPIQALQGMSSGVQVINNNGQPGSNPTVVIRGIGSMNASNAPLYVVDGVPYGGYINAISQSDIESITVLKDASASALYGSRAANGVIIITTKKGKSDEGKINVSSTFSFSKLAVDLPRRLSPQEFVETTWEAMYFGALDNGSSEADAALYATDNLSNEIKINPFSISKPVGTDGKLDPNANLLFEGNWNDELLKSRPSQEYTIDFSGKTNKTAYYFSASYLDDKGIFTTQKFNRISARSNVTAKVKTWLEMGTNTSFSHSLSDSPAGSSTVWFLRTVPSIYPVYEYDYDANAYKTDDNGKKIYDYGDNRQGWIGWNPLADAAYNKYETLVDNISTRNYAEITFTPELKFRSTFSLDYYLTSYHGYTTPDYGFMIGRGEVSKSTTRATTSTITNLLTYDKKINDHTFSILLGQEAYKFKRNYLYAAREDLPFGGLYELASAATMTGSDSYEDNYRLLSWFSRAEYDYKNKYYFSGSLRRDGTSRFSDASRFGTFWSLGASWRASEEDFFKQYDWLDNLKVKASYGAVGNDNLSTMYAYQGLYGTGYNDYGLPGLMISRLPNEGLKWETNLQFNVGLEFTVLNRLTGSLEYFKRQSKDLLFTEPMAPSTGFSGIDKNIGDVENKGVEFDLSWRIIEQNDFSWSMDINATHYKNEITKLPQEEMNSGVFKWREGESRYNFWGAEYAGINPENGNDQWWMNIYETVGGEEVIADRVLTENQTDVSSDKQKKYLGDALPDVFGGYTNNFKYKGLDLSVMFYYSLGGKLYDSDYSQMMGYRTGFSFHEDVLDAWTPENNTSSVTRLSQAFSNSLSSYSSKYIYNNSFVRLRNITLGYTLPQNILSKIDISSLRLFVKGDNLVTWGKAAKRGTDPEQSLSGTTDNRFPTVKSVSVGLQLSL